MSYFEIKTPRGTVFTVNGKGGKVTAEIEWNPGFGPSESSKFDRKQKFGCFTSGY